MQVQVKCGCGQSVKGEETSIVSCPRCFDSIVLPRPESRAPARPSTPPGSSNAIPVPLLTSPAVRPIEDTPLFDFSGLTSHLLPRYRFFWTTCYALQALNTLALIAIIVTIIFSYPDMLPGLRGNLSLAVACVLLHVALGVGRMVTDIASNTSR
jgi:hypothetical protein